MRPYKSYISIFLVFILLISLVASNECDAASKKVTLYVVSEIKIENDSGTITYKYSYNEHGLKAYKVHYNEREKYYSKYTYSGKKIKKISGNESNFKKYIFKYNKKGYPIFEKGIDVEGWVFDYTFSYDKKSRIKKIKYHAANDYTNNNIDWKYSYNKKNQVTKIKGNQTKVIDYKKAPVTYKSIISKTYKYDKKGYISKITEKNANNIATTTYKNTYDKNGCVTKVIKKSNSGPGSENTTYILSYKKITVSKTYEKLIKEQQNGLIPSGFSYDTLQ